VHVARGSLDVNGTALTAGDALKLKDAKTLTVAQGKQAEVIVFDLPAGD
jgi:quercetin 2,3-dioxygenase